MNSEYLHVNSSRWKTQMALLWGWGSSPNPNQPHPSQINSSVHRQGWAKRSSQVYFLKCQRSPKVIPTPTPFYSYIHASVR